MFNYNFGISKKVLQNRNPRAIFGNILTFLNCLLIPFQGIKSQFLAFISETNNKEKWVFETGSMEQLLNDKFAIGIRSIRIETLPPNSITPLADRYTGDSFLGDANSSTSFFLPTHDEAVLANGISYDFIVYADATVIAESKNEIIATIDYYNMSGILYQVRDNGDVINLELTT